LSIRINYTTIKEVEELRKDKERFKEFGRKTFSEILEDPQYYE